MSSCVVEVPPSVTVRSVAGFKEQLSTAFDTDGEIVLDLAALAELDLSFVQLVQSARLDLAGNARAIRLAQPAGEAVAALLERAGFLTDPDSADVEFWFHGDLPR
jgi:anti-anti-sigma regulatory factor